MKLVTADGDNEIKYEEGCFFINGLEVVTKAEIHATMGQDRRTEFRTCFKCGKVGHLSRV